MGSFMGHLDEAVFFLLLAAWWMYATFSTYIKSRLNKTEFRTRVSYPVSCCCKRDVPLEAFLKTLFPIVAITAELAASGATFVDEDGNFKNISNMLHITIITLFLIHGVVDIMVSCGVPLPKGIDYVTALVAFAWYGLAFTFHAHMHSKASMEVNIHILPVYVLGALVIAGIFELAVPHSFLPPLVRIYCMLMLGTWFTHVAFMLYLPTPWPGYTPNPAYDQADERNMHFVVAAFGFHLILNLCVIVITYLLTYMFLKVRGEGRYQFKPLLDRNEEEI